MDKIKQTPQQRKNTVEALEVMWPSVPAENVVAGLIDWNEDDTGEMPTCKTLACFGGWCAWWPAFRRQGIRVSINGSPVVIHNIAGKFVLAAYYLFGDSDIFDVRGHHHADLDTNAMSDHAVVTNRLHWLLKNSVVTA